MHFVVAHVEQQVTGAIAVKGIDDAGMRPVEVVDAAVIDLHIELRFAVDVVVEPRSGFRSEDQLVYLVLIAVGVMAAGAGLNFAGKQRKRYQ